jgi:hypothetical protein
MLWQDVYKETAVEYRIFLIKTTKYWVFIYCKTGHREVTSIFAAQWLSELSLQGFHAHNKESHIWLLAHYATRSYVVELTCITYAFGL